MTLATAASGVEVVLDGRAWLRAMAAEVRTGLTAVRKWLPSTLFYDVAGSALFERITETPEYYLTRTERALLQRHAAEVVELIRPRDIVELGSGSGRKIRDLLDAAGAGSERALRYVPMDVDPDGVSALVRNLGEDYPGLRVHGLVGDFLHHLGRVPPPIGPRLVVFLGSTIGNLHPGPRRAFLAEVGRLIAPSDGFLVGLDLVKPATVLEPAYDDRLGVTAAFNRNLLRVVNRQFGADFNPEAYRHHATFNAEASRMEMHLVPHAHQRVRVAALGLRVEIAPVETLWTESSYKFTMDSAADMLAEAGLALRGWYTDSRGMFALALAGWP